MKCSPISRFLLLLVSLILIVPLWQVLSAEPKTTASQPALSPDADRSPCDLVLTPDEKLILTANRTSHSVSLLRLADGRVLAELPAGKNPTAIALSPDGKRAYVLAASGSLSAFDLDGEKLIPRGQLQLGGDPRGIAVTADGTKAYVSLSATEYVALVDLEKMQVVAEIEAGQWPRTLALSPDGSRLAVGVNGDRGLAVIDTQSGKRLFKEQFSGLNIGQMHVSKDGTYVYFPWIVYRQNPINQGNIRAGWVLGSRIARVHFSQHLRREAMTLDLPGKAVADPHGLTMTGDEAWMIAGASGTQELLVYKMQGLVFQDYGGPGDHIDPALGNDTSRFYRIPLGGRPMTIRMAQDDRRVFVANYQLNAVQEVDLEKKAVVRTLSLGGPKEPSLARKGEAIFHDGKRSLDQWYSCASCHFEGGTNAVIIDTLNDGSVRTYKTVLPLWNVAETTPWTWHGWQKDLTAAARKSMIDTMLGPEPSEEDVQAMIAYMKTLEPPVTSLIKQDEATLASLRRGEALFQGKKGNCATCHSGPYLTDGKIHDVGLGGKDDFYQGFNTPSLVRVGRKTLFLHDGRATSLDQVLTRFHAPETVSGGEKLSEAEVADLVTYLKSL